MNVLSFDPESQTELEPLPTIVERLAEFERRLQRIERIQKYGCKCKKEECA